MAGNVLTAPLGAQGPPGVRAATVISPNLRAKGTAGYVATVADVPQFPSPLSVIGAWTVPDQRTMAMGIPTISASSAGITINPVTGTVGPMTVVQPDTRMRNG